MFVLFAQQIAGLILAVLPSPTVFVIRGRRQVTTAAHVTAKLGFTLMYVLGLPMLPLVNSAQDQLRH